MWLVFLLMMLGIFVAMLFIVWLANRVAIAMQKDNDKYENSKSSGKEGKGNE